MFGAMGAPPTARILEGGGDASRRPPSCRPSSRPAANREETVKKHGQDLVLRKFSTRVERANGRTNLSTQGKRR